MTKRKIIGLLNYWLIQLFFIRLTMKIEKEKVSFSGILYFVLPLTGWDSNYIFVGKQKHFRV